MTLSKEQIEAIQARAEKATPGPWHANSLTVFDRDGHAIAKTFPHPEVSTFERDNRIFIANARTDIPALCQMALRAIELEAERDTYKQYWLDGQKRLDEMAAELIKQEFELTTARNALEEERERCAKACYQVVGKYRALAKGAREKELDLSEDYYAARASAAEDCAEMVLRLPSPQVKG